MTLKYRFILLFQLKCFYQYFTNYTINKVILDDIFNYEPPKNAEFQNLAGEYDREYNLFLQKPALPISTKKYFSRFPDGRLLRVTLDSGGRLQLGNKIIYDQQRMRNILYSKAAGIPRDKNGFSTLNVIIYASPDASLINLLKFG